MLAGRTIKPRICVYVYPWINPWSDVSGGTRPGVCCLAAAVDISLYRKEEALVKEVITASKQIRHGKNNLSISFRVFGCSVHRQLSSKLTEAAIPSEHTNNLYRQFK